MTTEELLEVLKVRVQELDLRVRELEASNIELEERLKAIEVKGQKLC